MDEPNRSQDNNIHTLIGPMGKMACDSSGGENTEQHGYTLRDQVVSTKECFISETDVDELLHSSWF